MVNSLSYLQGGVIFNEFFKYLIISLINENGVVWQGAPDISEIVSAHTHTRSINQLNNNELILINSLAGRERGQHFGKRVHTHTRARGASQRPGASTNLLLLLCHVAHIATDNGKIESSGARGVFEENCSKFAALPVKTVSMVEYRDRLTILTIQTCQPRCS